MQWEYLLVRHFDRRLVGVGKTDIKKKQDQPDWETWLGLRGLEGWLLVTEHTLNKSESVHATLARPIENRE